MPSPMCQKKEEWDMIQEHMDAMEGGIETALKWIDKSKGGDSCVENGNFSVCEGSMN